ncbi:hypothetical protein LJB92_04160 [Bacteroidales bacterium OttesenSCG-928-M06]|nr:hypothetical protein [Bacteroidales bacterium OttesenSCG-928-M06]
MRQTVKVILYVVVFFITMLLSMVLKEAGLSFLTFFVVFPCTFAAWRAIKNYNPDVNKSSSSKLQTKESDDKYTLNKD